MSKIIYQYIDLPIARILLTSDGDALTGLYFAEQKQALVLQQKSLNNEDYEQQDLNIFHKTYIQLTEYLNGNLKEFTIAYSLIGTDFQKKVWSRLCNIPYGQLVSYQQIANLISAPTSTRAVANAIATNRLSIIVPCHRVIGSNSKLTGYAGGLEMKQRLLKLENPSVLHYYPKE